MTQDQEPTISSEKPLPVRQRDSSVVPFDINEYLPAEPNRRLWARFGNRSSGLGSDGESSHLFGTTQSTVAPGTIPRLILTMAVLLILAFGIVRVGIWTLRTQAAYPGVTQCYQIELWFHSVGIDISRIQWALADAEEQVTNEAEAEEANDRIWQMFADLRTSIAENPVPEELTAVQALWLQYLDIGLENRELSRQGETYDLDQRQQEQDEVLAQRLEEEERVRRNCRLAESESEIRHASQRHDLPQVATMKTMTRSGMIAKNSSMHSEAYDHPNRHGLRESPQLCPCQAGGT